MSFHVRIRVGAELYAMPVEHAIEVATLDEVTPVPGSRAEVLGVTNLRGQILPVVDLAQLLGVRRAEPPRDLPAHLPAHLPGHLSGHLPGRLPAHLRARRPGHLLVVEAAGRRAGFAIDEVREVGELPEPAEETDSELLRGSTLVSGELIGVIDVTRVFAVIERGRQ